MTGFPARRMGFKDRGLLREGYAADITVFNPTTIRDVATFDDPIQYPEGIPYVFVNGTAVATRASIPGCWPARF